MGAVPTPDTVTLDHLVADLWARSSDGQGRVRALLDAIDAVAPGAVDQVQARCIGRLLGLAPL